MKIHLLPILLLFSLLTIAQSAPPVDVSETIFGFAWGCTEKDFLDQAQERYGSEGPEKLKLDPHQQKFMAKYHHEESGRHRTFSFLYGYLTEASVTTFASPKGYTVEEVRAEADRLEALALKQFIGDDGIEISAKSGSGGMFGHLTEAFITVEIVNQNQITKVEADLKASRASLEELLIPALTKP